MLFAVIMVSVVIGLRILLSRPVARAVAVMTELILFAQLAGAISLLIWLWMLSATR